MGKFINIDWVVNFWINKYIKHINFKHLFCIFLFQVNIRGVQVNKDHRNLTEVVPVMAGIQLIPTQAWFQTQRYESCLNFSKSSTESAKLLDLTFESS